MAWVVAGVTVAMLLRALDPARCAHWWDFSRTWAAIGVGSTAALLTLVTLLGVWARSAVEPQGSLPVWLQQILAGLLAHAALRRMKSSDRGGTLVLGVLPDVNKWVDFFVRVKVVAWADDLDDQRLVAAAARLDNKLKGKPTEATFDARVARRELLVGRLAMEGQVREQARLDLIDTIETGYSAYGLRRRP